MVRLIEVDGEKHIQGGSRPVPVDSVPEACAEGIFDECSEFDKVLQLYFESGSRETDLSFMPVLRQIVAINALKWIVRDYGAPRWDYQSRSLVLDVRGLRLVLICHVEAGLMESDPKASLEERMFVSYRAMIDFEKEELNAYGRGIIAGVLDTYMRDNIKDEADQPTTIH